MPAKTNPNRVAVLTTHIAGEYLIIRANPSAADVASFVAEHNRRYHLGEPGGPSGEPAFLVKAANFFDVEPEGEPDFVASTDIDLSSVLDSAV